MGRQTKKRKQTKKKQMNNKGFTLIELLAVITIMGILMMVAIPAVSRTIENSRRDSFATVAQNYVNAVRNSVLADEFECGGVTVSGTQNGAYYFRIDSTQNSSKDLMESGGTSPWGGADVKGYVAWYKEDTTTAGGGQSTTKTTYKISLVDKGHHGIPTYETDQKITRAKVVTNAKGKNDTGAEVPMEDAIVPGTSGADIFCKTVDANGNCTTPETSFTECSFK